MSVPSPIARSLAAAGALSLASCAAAMPSRRDDPAPHAGALEAPQKQGVVRVEQSSAAPPSPGRCVSRQRFQPATGPARSCYPYRCVDGRGCLASCRTDRDCAVPAGMPHAGDWPLRCESTGRCVPMMRGPDGHPME